VTRILQAEARRIAGRVQQDGADAAQDETLWAEHEQNLTNTLLPYITNLALFGVRKVRESLAESEAIGINWSLANERAAEWARQYVGDRSKTLTETTRKLVREQVAQWIESGETLPDLVRRVGTIVQNPVRAEMIAVTEATNTYAEANSAAWSEAGYGAAGFRPAAHVSCRCYLQPYKLPDGSKVQVWYTARDEHVCKQPLAVPWKAEPAKGCRELHTTVVSQGEYVGMKLADAIRVARAKG